jgi:hypothetical protein
MRQRSHTPLDIILQGLEQGLRNCIAEHFVIRASAPGGSGAFRAEMIAAVEFYHHAIEDAVQAIEPTDFDIFSGEPERETTGADYGRDDP